MGMLRKYRRQVKKNIFRFPMDMYNNVLGSLIITHYMLYQLENTPVDLQEIRKRWRELTKHPKIDFWIDDPKFIEKALALFNMKPIYGRFAMVQSPLNILFLPYIDNQILPIRENGVYPATARNGKIYPVEEKNDKQGS